MRTFEGVALGGASNESGVVDDSHLNSYTSSETSDMWPAVLYGDTLPLVCL